MNLSDNIKSLKGIGDKTSILYNKVGINDVDDLIHYYPRDYCFFDELTKSTDLCIDKIIVFRATVISRPLVKKVRRLHITSAKLNCYGILITSTWFHMPYLNKILVAENDYVFRGKLSNEGDHYHIEQPMIFTCEQYNELANSISPLYSLTKGLSNNAITKVMKSAFNNLDESDYEDGLYDLHFPDSFESLSKARGKLVYEEFLLFILRLRLMKDNNEKAINNFNIIEVSECERIIERLPYRLTNAQIKVWKEIKEDMTSCKSMSRLVQGDVGSGKTILAILAACMCGINGYQAAVMAPTEILARQHFEGFCQIIKENDLNIKAVLLTGSQTSKTKEKIREEISSGQAKIIIGTHALIQEKVEYNNLALVITDEQHRFGVNQREILSEKNREQAPHILVMSATPIPRTLAIILYGDLSISIIDEVPAHKLPIKNAVVTEKFRAKAIDFMKKEIAQGHQVYIICPLVEESEGLDAKDVISVTDELNGILPEEIKVAYLHGKMKANDKQRVMDDFACNNIQILVSTTVVEVGVNVPNATVMLIENADRFGLAQLHQLRGRVGRGKAQSYCIFMSGNDNKKTMERLEVLKNSNDGFVIAEEDLKQRGPGDLFGIRQSGQMEFKLGDIFTDAKVLKEASEEAEKILEEDPDLSLDKNKKLREKLNRIMASTNIGQTI